ncbi:MAG: hypothetical protein JW929_03315 [Anaerolineales bacterium]|nr:hypothetical protein [Anaerolineales bacterium]
MTMPLVFSLAVLFFAAIGSLRGWAKELLVSCALVLAMFINMLLDKYASGLMASLPAPEVFAIRAGVFAILAYFGYLTPRLPWIPADRFLRERLQDWLLGIVLGALNGLLLFGSLWFFLHQAGYPFPGFEQALAHARDPEIVSMMKYMPPILLGELWVFVAVAVAFIFVIVVFV